MIERTATNRISMMPNQKVGIGLAEKVAGMTSWSGIPVAMGRAHDAGWYRNDVAR